MTTRFKLCTDRVKVLKVEMNNVPIRKHFQIKFHDKSETICQVGRRKKPTHRTTRNKASS